MAWAQALRGDKVHFVAGNYSECHRYTTFNPYASTHFFDAQTPDPNKLSLLQLQNAVALLDPYVDLFHVHNEPNYLFRAVKEMTDKPIIFDIHDWTSVRESKDTPQVELDHEKFAIENADGICVVSKGYLEKIRKITNKPTLWIKSMVPRQFFSKGPRNTNPGLVYEGGTKGRNNLLYNYPYRNWASFAQEAVKKFENGSKIYFYTANDGEDFTEYQHEKINVYPPQNYHALISFLRTHSVGLVGSPFPIPDFADSLPNKLFEYTAAGIPCIVINAPEAEKYAVDNGLGIGVRDASEVYDALATLTDHPIEKDRWGYTMESELPKLDAFYEEVIECSRNQNSICQIENLEKVIQSVE